jgi:WD40 repeat protein
VREHVEPTNGDRGPVVCPFKGLASFEVADAQYYFGRERLVAELVAHLVGAPLLGIVGPSGSGKSSVVRAGLLPALADGVLPGSEDWQRVLMRPGVHPAHELDRVFAGLANDRRTVLAVDQFEETFTACRDEEERAHFIGRLVHMAQGRDGDVVVLAIRADFYGRCATYPDLARLLAANHVLVGAMRHVELRRAVVGPAERVGLYVQPELADALVSDVEDEPGALPLLSTALLELWQRRDGRELRLSSYEDTHGVHGAVARLAEEAFARLDAEQQTLARRVLLRLAEVEPEGGVERRRLPLTELEAADGDRVGSMIGLLADARLLTVSEGSVEFSHEALLREWPRLRDWVEDDRDDLRVHRSLSSASQEWLRLGRDDSALYRGARLAEASEWAERGDPGPSDAERAFLAASRERDVRDRRARKRRLAIAFTAMTFALVAIGAAAIVAIEQREDADRQRNVALSRQLALESEKALAVDPEQALSLALWGYDTEPTGQAAKALREATLAFRELGTMRADSLDANAAAYSPDGERVVTGGTDGRALVWDAASQRQLARLDAGHGAIFAARYAPQGDRIALGFEDGTVAVTDGALGTPRTLLQVEDAPVRSLAFTRDGGQIAVALDDGTVRVIGTGESGPEQRLSGHDGPVLGVDINADGSRVASAGDDGTVRLWTLPGSGSGQIVHSGELPERDVEFSPDGKQVLGVGDDRQVRIWNVGTGTEKTRFDGEGRQLNAAAFSVDGSRFAVGGRDGVTRVWSANGGPPVAVLRGQPSRVLDVGFGARSDRVVSAGNDGSVRTWDAGRTQVWTVPSKTWGLDFDRTGRRVATGSADGTVRVWDPATGELQASLPGPDGFTVALFSPSADTLLVANPSHVLLWPVLAERADVVVQPPKGDGIGWAEFDATGDRIVYVTLEGKVALRDLASGREVTFGGTPKVVYGAAINPDGQHAIVVPERDVLLYRLDRLARPERLLRAYEVQSYDFSADGRLVTAGSDRTGRIWDPDGRQTAVLRGPEDELTSALFTADGKRVLTSSNDGSLRLYDARDGTELAVLQAPQGQLYGVALSPDGDIATLGSGDVVRVFPCEVCGTLDEVRALARSRSPRPLTATERQQLLAAAE